jgi:superfamily II DNA helicase RecQ
MTNQTIKEMASNIPVTKSALAAIGGIGQSKVKFLWWVMLAPGDVH